MILSTRGILQIAGVLLTTIFIIVAHSQFNDSSSYSFRALSSTSSVFNQRVRPSPVQSKNAYCVFLAEPNEAIKPGEEDVYFVGTRMLVYQLLHDPETRSASIPQIPVIVLVDSEVPDWKREQLRSDGALVVQVEHQNFNWIKPNRVRWAHVMDKLAVFRLVDYDKILLLDTDMVVTRPLDGVFNDPASQLIDNGGNPAETKDDEGPQPPQYIMAGNPQTSGGRLNAGFVLLRPSIEIYEHYVAVASIPGRFKGGSPEQDLWNYVHRWSGNMPWKQLDEKWTVNSPTYKDYEDGKVTFHEKYWRCRDDLKLRDVLLRSRWKMEGYFSSLMDGRSTEI